MEGTAWKIETLAASDSRVPDVLALAFAEVPLTRWVLRDPGDPALVRRYVGALAAIAGPASLALCEREDRGAALWVRPGRWRGGFWRRARHAPSLLAMTGLRRAASRFHGLGILAADHPETPHYYLEMMGVRPDARGAGLGDALLCAGLVEADAARVPVCLHSSNPRVVPLYERRGFRVVGEIDLPHGGPRVWSMQREPGGSV